MLFLGSSMDFHRTPLSIDYQQIFMAWGVPGPKSLCQGHWNRSVQKDPFQFASSKAASLHELQTDLEAFLLNDVGLAPLDLTAFPARVDSFTTEVRRESCWRPWKPRSSDVVNIVANVGPVSAVSAPTCSK